MKKRSHFRLFGILAVIAAAMIALFPLSSRADETTPVTQQPGGDKDENGMHAGKHIEVLDDGTYTISLDAYATGEATFDTVTVPADIILVLDVSGSMADDMGQDTYEYTARASQAYSYSNYGYNQYYYKDADGNYHLVERNYNNGRYYLRYGAQGNRTYLTGTTTQSSRPTDSAPTNENTTIWTGVLYERTTISAPSKMDALKSAVNTFIDEVASKNAEAAEANPDGGNDVLSRIAIVKFAGTSRNGTSYSNYYNNIGNETYNDGGYTYNYTQVVADLGVVTEANKQDTWKSKVNAFNPGGATSADYGMNYANAIIDRHANDYNYTDENADNYRSRVVVMFTDGEPNHSRGFDGTVANTTVSTSRTLKTTKNTTVFTVAVYEDANPSLDPTASSTSNINKYLHGVSSNYPNATAYTSLGTRAEGNYYFAATNASELEAIFKEIGKSSGSTTTEVGKEAVMKDIISPAFTLPEGAKESDISIKIVRWNSTTHAWGTGEGYEFTAEQWKTASTTYGAETAEDVSASISADGKTVDVTGFDYKTHFKATSSEQDNDQYDVVNGVNKNTAKIVVFFPIQAKPSAVTGSTVATNGEDSGIYVNGEAIIKFEVPEVEFTPVTYVVDYVTSDTSHDTKASTIKLDYSGVLKNVQMLDNPSDDYLKGELASQFGYTIYKGQYGTISFGDDENDVQRRYVRYAPTTMNWDGYDRIFVKGESNTNNNLDVWAMLCVIPANSVFYEDTYISQTKTVTYNDQQVTIEYTGIAYDSNWSTVGTEGKNQTQHAGDEMGWVNGLADDSTYANDMAHTTSTAKAKANFTFTGTGVDIYSRTNGATGVVSVNIKSLATENESGKKVNKSQIIDTKAAMGDFFAIPVCTFTDLPYGKYTATITVTTGGQSEGRMVFYLDGVRVYNPIKPLEEEENVQNMYGEKNLGAVFTEVRSLLGTSTDATAKASALYIDEHTISEIVTDVDAIEAAAKALAKAQEDRDTYVESTITPAKNALSEEEYALSSAESALDSATKVYEAAKTAYDAAVTAGAAQDEIDKLEATMNEALTDKQDADAAYTAAQQHYDDNIAGLTSAVDAAIAGKAYYDTAVDAARDAYDEVNDGVVLAHTTTDVELYNKEGPKSEVLLSTNQQVAINVEPGKYYYIGLRSLNGDEVKVLINGSELKLSHSTDLYYECTPTGGSEQIVIKNNSGENSKAILSVTKLRTTGIGNTTNGTKSISIEETMKYVRSLAEVPVTNYTGEVLAEFEVAAGDTTIADESVVNAESEIILEEDDIVIDNPDPTVDNGTNEETQTTQETQFDFDFWNKLMSSFFGFFHR